MSTIWWTFNQACAWVTWRDDESVARVGPDGDRTFRMLFGSRARYTAPVRRDAAGNEIDHRDSDGKPIRYQHIDSGAPFRAPPRVGLSAQLYEACSRGQITAYGRFDGGRSEAIPSQEWSRGRPPRGWTELTFDMAELRRTFPNGDEPEVTMPTGAPGRPSSMNAIRPEFERRLAENTCQPKLKLEAEYLRRWFRERYPTAQAPTVKTLENKIRGDYRRWEAGLP